MNILGIEFGTQNYWDYHGVLFLLFITIFPRLTLFFSSVPFGGFIWWLGFFFAPRLLVAALATVAYGHSNPILVIMSWLVAISGESGEKYFVRKRVRVVHINKPAPEAVDVEFRRLD